MGLSKYTCFDKRRRFLDFLFLILSYAINIQCFGYPRKALNLRKRASQGNQNPIHCPRQF